MIRAVLRDYIGNGLLGMLKHFTISERGGTGRLFMREVPGSMHTLGRIVCKSESS